MSNQQSKPKPRTHSADKPHNIQQNQISWKRVKAYFDSYINLQFVIWISLINKFELLFIIVLIKRF